MSFFMARRKGLRLAFARLHNFGLLKIARSASIFRASLIEPGSRPFFEKLSVNAKKLITFVMSFYMARWKGLEPLTYWFVASHSIQLSYQRISVSFRQVNILSANHQNVNP